MPYLGEAPILRFDSFLLDRQTRTLSKLDSSGRQTPVQIGSRAFQILCLLLDRRTQIVSQHEIMDAVWPNSAVEPNNLTVQLAGLRRVLDADRGNKGSCIQNIPGRGYRFVLPVSEISSPRSDEAEPASVAGDPGITGPGKSRRAAGIQPGHDAPDAVDASPRGVAWRSLIRWWPARVASVLVLSLCAAGLLAATWHFRGAPATRIEQAAVPATIALPVERPRLSLVVLPFLNFGGEGLDDATVDAITEDITVDAARYSTLLVIARSSAFAYKGRHIDIKRLGQELGARYAVEGSVRKSEGALRITVQLISTDTAAHVWSDRFEAGSAGAGYSLDNVIRQITFLLELQLTIADNWRNARERPNNPDFTDLLTRARAIYGLPPSLEKSTQLVALYERAVALNPSSPVAISGLAEALLESIYISPGDDPAAPKKSRRAEELINRAELLSPSDRPVMLARLLLLGTQLRCPELIPFAQRASELYPNLSSPHFLRGFCMLLAGRASDAIARFEDAIRAHPRNPAQNVRYSAIGYALLYLGRYDESVASFERALSTNAAGDARWRAEINAAIAAAHALAGDEPAARYSAAEATRLLPTLTARGFFQSCVADPERHSPMNPVYAAQVSRMRDGLRLAGVRDHADEDAAPGIAPDNILHTDYEVLTPHAVPGARTIATRDLTVLLGQRKPVVLDTLPWGKSIPGAIGLWGAGIGGNVNDEYQERLGRKLQQLTSGDRSVPIVTLAWNAERYQGRNLALRLVALGYAEVYWYRGGREAWQVGGQPVAEVVTQDW